MLCYVDHHDAAYRWAERRRIETHPVTGATQLVEVRERVEEVAVRKSAPTKKAPVLSPLFAHRTDDEWLGYNRTVTRFTAAPARCRVSRKFTRQQQLYNGRGGQIRTDGPLVPNPIQRDAVPVAYNLCPL